MENNRSSVEGRSIKEIGTLLSEMRSGTMVTTKKSDETLLYVKYPVSADLILLHKCTFVLGDSNLLKDLFELNPLRIGCSTR